MQNQFPAVPGRAGDGCLSILFLAGFLVALGLGILA